MSDEATPVQECWKKKIFTHKHLDPACVETGCQSLFIQTLQAELESERAKRKEWQKSAGDGLALLSQCSEEISRLTARAEAAEQSLAAVRLERDRICNEKDSLAESFERSLATVRQESEARRKALLEVGIERSKEWQRAEKAEAQLTAAQEELRVEREHLERTSDEIARLRVKCADSQCELEYAQKRLDKSLEDQNVLRVHYEQVRKAFDDIQTAHSDCLVCTGVDGEHENGCSVGAAIDAARSKKGWPDAKS